MDLAIVLTLILAPAWFAIFWIDRSNDNEDLGALFAVIAIALLVVAALLAVPFIYYTAFHMARGWTPGKRMLGLQLVAYRTGEHPTNSMIVGRYFTFIGSILVGPMVPAAIAAALPTGDPNSVLGIVAMYFPVFAPMLLHPEGRGWHDPIAGTMVVRAESSAADTSGVVSGQ